MSKKQVNEIKAVIVGHAQELVAVNASKAAGTLKQYAPDLLQAVLDALEEGSDAQYQYLKALVEPEVPPSGESHALSDDLPPEFTERYVQLLCKYNKSHVADYVSLLNSGDLKLDPGLEYRTS